MYSILLTVNYADRLSDKNILISYCIVCHVDAVRHVNTASHVNTVGNQLSTCYQQSHDDNVGLLTE